MFTRVFGCASIAALTLIVSLPEAHAQPVANGKPRYLALGDSLAFGFDPSVPVALENYHGYPELVSKSLKKAVANGSCFGESSGSFLVFGQPDLGCQFWRTAGLPMYETYTGSQMDFAIDYLEHNKKVDLISINIGGNDLELVLQKCGTDVGCQLGELPQTLLTFSQNLLTIYTRIRATGYQGPIVALTYYAFDYNDLLQVGAFGQFNQIVQTITTAFGGTVADGYGAFLQASSAFNGSTCAAGLLVKDANGICGTHPSAAGQALLAGAVLDAIPASYKK